MKVYVLLMLGGISAGISLSFPVLWPLVLVSLMPILHSVYRKDLSTRTLFLHGLVFGISLMGATLYWFFNTLPLTWLGVSSVIAASTMVFVAWTSLSVVLSLAVGCWAVLAHTVLTRSALDMLSVPFLWVLFEYFRMWLYAIMMHGPGALLEPHFSFGFLGYSLAANPGLLSVAHIGGVYALSFIVALFSVALYLYIGKSERRISTSIIVLLVLLSVVPLSPKVPPNTSLLHIETVETDFKSTLRINKSERESRVKILEGKIRSIVDANPNLDVLVLPEASRFIQGLAREEAGQIEALKNIIGDREVLIVDSWRVEEKGQTFSRIVFFSSTRGLLAQQDKRFLIVFGEYMPYLGEIVLRVFGKGEEVDAVKRGRSYQAAQATNVFDFRGTKLGALSCSEVVSPWLYRSSSKKDLADVFINVSSQSWFHHGANPRNQLTAMAKVHSVWSNRQYIQSSNGAPSFRFPQDGR